MFRGYVALLLAVCGLVVVCAPALAASEGPGWEIDSHSYPTNLAPGSNGLVAVVVYNIGAGGSESPATVTDTLPDGVVGVSSRGWSCTGSAPDVCTLELGGVGGTGRVETELEVNVEADAPEGQVANRVTVSGGGAPSTASASNMLTISSKPAGFGFAGVDAWVSNANGTIDTQAGSHPYELTFNWELNTENNVSREAYDLPADREEVRNLAVNAPPGLIGNPQAVPRCARQQFDDRDCSPSTQVGMVRAAFGPEIEPRTPTFVLRLPLYNITPPPGLAAQFGLTLLGVHVFLDASVRSGGDYGITEHVDNIPQRTIVWSSTTLWGVPSEASHDGERCGEINGTEACGFSSSAPPTPFLTLPTSCSGQPAWSADADSWRGPTTEVSFPTHDSEGNPAGFTGCDHLGFGPSLSVAPDTSYADTPAGLTVELRTPQEGLSNVEGLAMSNIKDTTVTLPEGVAINPGQAAGLQACQASEDGVGTEGPASCPNASRVGTDEVETPLLAKPLVGSVYVLQSNPPNLKLLVTASGEGVNLKLVGDVHLDETTGRLTSTFSETPEVPFTSFRLSFSGGAQAALSTPTQCGLYTTTSDFTPWSTPLVQDVFPTSDFAIEHGTADAGCPSTPLPFSPQLVAGSTTDQAAGYTDFSLLLTRPDDQQRISGLQFKTPEGLLGMISKVPLCPEPQASEGTCSSASQIGHTVVEAGPGPYPLVVPQPGQPPAPIYLTGPYKGAPYGLSIVVPLVVGPFTLQTQVVRARIEVDPRTARLTVTTDPLPQIIDGVPADLRSIDAVIDRPEFMFNPTNCSPQSFSGTATSTEGATAAIESHFQVGSCQSLKFAPDFEVSTSGKTSKADGASLTAKILYPNVTPGNNQASSQSNIASVKVELPKRLPSRLTTLQKACTAAQFESNPAGCPAGSLVGHAIALTPVLPVPVSGPVYFVSHGGEAFPSLIMVLQGYGVTIDLEGSTFINPAGITSSTFKSVPDVPITSFELTLPEGPFSAITAVGNLCKATKLAMPTEFVAQDGAVIDQSTKIDVTGCPKAKKATSKKSKRHKKKHKRHKR